MSGILGVDVGGTFTDFLLVEDGRLRTFKRPSTPAEPGRAVVDGMQEMGSAPDELVHGSTVATNAVLERKGARTGLITTRGFRDVIEIGRQTRPRIYDLEPRRPEPLAPRELRYEVDERVDAQGAALRAPSAAAIEAVLDQATAAGVESLAISLIFSYLYPEHERLIAAAARRREIWVSVSSELVPEYREYERMSTTAINAFLAPVVGTYMRRLEAELRHAGVGRLRIVQSDGGSASAAAVAERAVSTVLSGPAAGVAGAFAAGQLAGFDRIISFDMGGTSTDVALCPGRIVERLEIEIGGLPARVPAIDVHTVGAGGGSLARLDVGGALRVGPESAGAEPGPACYGRGTEPTVTDAQLVLGRLQPEHFLGGRMGLDRERAQAALARLGGDPVAQAAAILRVANANMERAIRVISVERGYDPRDFTLLAFGGAGPLHACDLAAALRIPRVLVPPFPGVLSAFGMVTAPVTRVYQRPVMRALTSETEAEVRERLYAMALDLEQAGRRELTDDGHDGAAASVELSLDMRYQGQSYEIGVPVPHPIPGPLEPPSRHERLGGWHDPAERGGSVASDPSLTLAGGRSEDSLAADFHERHRQRYGHADPARAVEVVNLRLRLSVAPPPLRLEPPPSRPGGPERAQLARAPQWYGRWLEAPIYDRDLLSPADQLEGPTVIVQMDTTTALPPGWSATVDGIGNLLLEAVSHQLSAVRR
jgi:N-methylhydantoinase A